jgi:hypothetical protein
LVVTPFLSSSSFQRSPARTFTVLFFFVVAIIKRVMFQRISEFVF